MFLTSNTTHLRLLISLCSYVGIVFFLGKIACANVVSDLYAMGVTKIDNVLMLLAVSTKMTENEKFVISKLIIDGFKVS